GFFRSYVLFNRHVSELARVKDIAAFLAFHKFCVFLARHDPHARVPANFLHSRWFGRPLRDWQKLDWVHIRFRRLSLLLLSRIAGILCPLLKLSSGFPHPRRKMVSLPVPMDEDFLV